MSASFQTAAADIRAPATDRLAVRVAFALAVANLAFLIAALVNGYWLIDADGHGAFTDFVNVWSAGRLVLEGDPAGAYVPAIHQAYQALAVGHPVTGYFGWPYPPTFLGPAALLALLPYVAAFVVFVAITVLLYLATIRAIIGDRVGLLYAAAFPALIATVMVGQNGCLTAALIGGALVLLPRRPVVAGCLIGLLSYKPHFGVLFPLALAAGAHWRAFAAAAVVTLGLAALSVLAFGTGVWATFLQSLLVVNHAILSEGRADWGKLQSVYGAVRALGGGNGLAWTLHGLVAVASAAGVVALWRTRPGPLPAAALGVGAILVTPYVFLYDLVVLAVPMAFLIRAARDDGLSPGEWAALAGACLLILCYPLVSAPVGLPATLLVAGLVIRRAWTAPDAAAD